MTTFVLEHGEGPQETTVADAETLGALLDQVEAEAERLNRPSLPTLYDNKGRSLAIGVGGGMSVVVWHDDNDPDNGDLLSLGNSPIEEVSFYYGNQYSFFPGSALVTNEDARRAMKEFIQSGQRPSNIRWQE